jgi:hypothetical protein
MPTAPTFQTYVAVAIILCFFGFAFFIASQSMTLSDSQWTRLYAIFSSLEALGFAAAGMILGRTIDAPNLSRLRDLERQNAAFSMQQKQSDEAFVSLEQDIGTARSALAETQISGGSPRDTDIPLERALMRIGTLRQSTPSTPAASDS